MEKQTMNNIEHEAKVLNINIEEIRTKLQALNATKIGDFNFKRHVFDTIPSTPNRWVRLRSDGHETTLTIKEIATNTIDGTHEWETKVDDFDTMLTILSKIGIESRGYQENTREEYKLEGAQVVIDCWPKLQPYIEIEAKDTAEVIRIAELLGYGEDQLVADNTSALYEAIGIDLKDVAELKFDKE